MTTEGGSGIPTHQHNILDWLEDSIPFLPSFLDEPYSLPNDITNYDWWAQLSDPNPDHLFHLPPAASTAASPVGPASTPTEPSSPVITHQPQLSKKRRRRPVAAANEETEGNNSSDSEVHRKPLVHATGRRTSGKLTGANSNSNSSKEVRWAEQLLNPLAAAIAASNLSRVQHLLYVLQELASATGDANHRLASHGLHALTRHLSPSFTSGDQNPTPRTFTTTEPKLFRSALIKFHEVSPWFTFPNSLANASILQTLTLDSSTNQRQRNLHVVDIGVSHGIQWPTLLEALTRRSNGVPSLVRLTVACDAIPPGPFSSPPPGYDFPSHLVRYAKSIDLNLKIDRVSDLTPRYLSIDRNEVLVICAQFRAHHCDSEQRTSFLRSVKELDADLVILTEIDGGEGTTAAGGFAKRAEILWTFLDSTNAAFKGRDCAERRVVEGEMARVLEQQGEGVGEGRERWRERMLGLGFREEGFGEEAVDGGRALLRKYDGNWEMRAAEGGGGIGLWWKGQPVSFCSIWKTVARDGVNGPQLF